LPVDFSLLTHHFWKSPIHSLDFNNLVYPQRKYLYIRGIRGD